MSKPTNTFQLWKENRVSGEYTMTFEECAREFIRSPFYDYYYRKGWPLSRALFVFIGTAEGLNSATDPDESQTIIEGVRAALRQIEKEPQTTKP